MFKNYLKIALRNLLRNKGYTFINVAGLAIGIACCIVVYEFVQSEVRYDKYHELGNRIYRITTRAVLMSTGEEEVMADSPFLWGPAMKREYPEVADYARFSAATQSSDPWEIRRDEIAFSESKILYADASVFGIFSWPLKQGDAQTALLIPSLSCSRKAWLANTSVRKIRSAKS